MFPGVKYAMYLMYSVGASRSTGSLLSSPVHGPLAAVAQSPCSRCSLLLLLLPLLRLPHALLTLLALPSDHRGMQDHPTIQLQTNAIANGTTKHDTKHTERTTDNTFGNVSFSILSSSPFLDGGQTVHLYGYLNKYRV